MLVVERSYSCWEKKCEEYNKMAADFNLSINFYDHPTYQAALSENTGVTIHSKNGKFVHMTLKELETFFNYCELITNKD